MKVKSFIVFILLIFQSLAEQKKGTDAGNSIAEDLTKSQNKFLGFIDDNLPDNIHAILEKISNNKLSEVQETLNDRINLQFLAIAHHNGIAALNAALRTLEETLIISTRIIMEAAALRRGELEVSTIIYPFEYHGHKCGFARNVNI